jgi:hypothetical protein
LLGALIRGSLGRLIIFRVRICYRHPGIIAGASTCALSRHLLGEANPGHTRHADAGGTDENWNNSPDSPRL